MSATLALVIPADATRPMTLEYLDGPGSLIRHLGEHPTRAIDAEDFTAYVCEDAAALNTRADYFVHDQVPELPGDDRLAGTVVLVGLCDEHGADADVPARAIEALGLA